MKRGLASVRCRLEQQGPKRSIIRRFMQSAPASLILGIVVGAFLSVPLVRRLGTTMPPGLDKRIAEDIYLIACAAYPDYTQETKASGPQKSALETLADRLGKIRHRLFALLDFLEERFTVEDPLSRNMRPRRAESYWRAHVMRSRCTE